MTPWIPNPASHPTSVKTDRMLIEAYDAVLSDLDGVVYAGKYAIPGAPQALQALAGHGVRLGYITNNASRSAAQVAEHLRELGAPATEDQVFGSAVAGAELLALQVPAGSRVLVTGSEFLREQVRSRGLTVVESAADNPDAVIQGFDPGLGWKDLAEASYAVNNGALWVATNTDMSIPQARGIAPGNGSLVAAVSAATGRLPLVAGKPEPVMFLSAAEHLGSSRPLVVGDRLDTDILGGNRAGFATAAVLTGVDSRESILAARTAERPSYMIESLDDFYQPYPAVLPAAGGFSCGGASAQVIDGVVRISGGRGNLDSWRAACAAWWNASPEQDSAVEPQLSWDSAG